MKLISMKHSQELWLENQRMIILLRFWQSQMPPFPNKIGQFVVRRFFMLEIRALNKPTNTSN